MEDVVQTARATLSYARISSRKVKIVADLIRGKDIDEALAIVKYAPKASSEILEKLLKSAISNAENNHHMEHSKFICCRNLCKPRSNFKKNKTCCKRFCSTY